MPGQREAVPGVRFARGTAALLLALLLSGCGALPVTLPSLLVPAAVSGAGGGIAYTFTNIAYKTTNHPIGKVRVALRQALRKLAITVKEEKDLDAIIRVRAATERLRIYIDLERVTEKATRIRVNAKRGLILKDKATAIEIITLTEKFLQEKEGSDLHFQARSTETIPTRKIPSNTPAPPMLTKGASRVLI